MKHWDTGFKNMDQKQFRQQYRKAYGWAADHSVDTADSGTDILYRKTKGGDKLIVVHQLQVFDIVKEAHCSSSHLKLQRTLSILKHKYHNITAEHVKCYIKLCIICNGEQPKVRPVKGARKPIKSHSYRDRIQVDLIDFREDPHPEYEQHDDDTFAPPLMTWLMVVKDHFTRLVYMRPIPSKAPRHVARELVHIYSPSLDIH